MAQKYRILSADGHLEISPERWTPRVPNKYKARAPRLIDLPDGGNAVAVENRPLYIVGLALGGRPFEEHTPRGLRYEDSAGAGSPEQRLREQEQDGIDGEVLYLGGVGPNLWRGIKDNDAYKAMFHAYNEFLGEEYCAVAPDRLIGMGAIPDTGIGDAIAELEHCARLELKGIVLYKFPSGKGYPTPEDDRFWAAALDVNMPVTVHVSLRANPGEPSFKHRLDPGELDFGGRDYVRLLSRFATAGHNTVQLILAGVFDRFPKLQIFWAETQVAWVPSFLEGLDDAYERNRHWAKRLLGLEPLKRRPSEYVQEHSWWGFNRDVFGMKVRNEVDVNKLMWGSDFPHAISDWPHSDRLFEEMFAGVTEEERHKMVVSNAVEFFHLENVT